MLLTRFFPNDWGMGCRVTKKCSGNSNALLPGRVRKKGTAMEQPWIATPVQKPEIDMETILDLDASSSQRISFKSEFAKRRCNKLSQ